MAQTLHLVVWTRQLACKTMHTVVHNVRMMVDPLCTGGVDCLAGSNSAGGCRGHPAHWRGGALGGAPAKIVGPPLAPCRGVPVGSYSAAGCQGQAACVRGSAQGGAQCENVGQSMAGSTGRLGPSNLATRSVLQVSNSRDDAATVRSYAQGRARDREVGQFVAGNTDGLAG